LFHHSVRPSPLWNTQLGAARRAAAKQTNSRATSTARHGPYLLVRVRVRPEPVTEHNPAPSPSSLSTHPQRAREPEKPHAERRASLSSSPSFLLSLCPSLLFLLPPFQRREDKRVSLSPCRSYLILPLSGKFPRYSPLRGTPSSVGRFRLLAEVSLWAHAAGALEGGAGELLWGRWRGGRRQELVSQATRGQGVGWARMHTSRAPPADPSHLPGRLSRGCEPRRQLNHGGSR
jgi:hypothetical protein